MVKINSFIKGYLTEKGFKNVQSRNILEGKTKVIVYNADAKKTTPKLRLSAHSTKSTPRIHIASLTSNGDIFLFKGWWKHRK